MVEKLIKQIEGGQPNKTRKSHLNSRKMFPFNFKSYFDDGLIQVKDKNKVEELQNIEIDNWDMTMNGKWNYYGQVNPTTKKPDGIGFAIRSDNLDSGEIVEGNFKNGTGSTFQ